MPTVQEQQREDAGVVEPLRVSVAFERRVQPADYETKGMSAFVQSEISSDDTPEQIAAKMREATSVAQTIVFDTLGIAYEVDEEGILHEDPTKLVERAFPGSTKVEEAPKSAPAKGKGKATKGKGKAKDVDGVPAEPPYDPETDDPDERKANREWAEARLEVAPDEFWDNRKDRKGKAPHYRHKVTRLGVWIKGDGK